MNRIIVSSMLSFLMAACWGSETGIEGGQDSATDGSFTDTPGDPVLVDTLDDTAPPLARYALHEWGVFVYEVGGTGASVHGPSPDVMDPMVDKPVIYLYPETDLTLDVSVGFASGGATETWPETDLGPHVSWNDVHVSPGACDPTPFPNIYDEPWVYDLCEACTLGTCVVEEAACLTVGDQVSRLLFYAGDMPGMAAPLSGLFTLIPGDPGTWPVARYDVLNTSGRSVKDVWLMYRQTTSNCMYYEYCPVTTADLAVGYIGTLAPGAGVTVDLPVVHLEAELDSEGMPIPGTLGSSEEWDETSGEIRAALVEQGLFLAEADAFMAAWHVAMFGLLGSDSYMLEPLYRNGASMLYFLDRETYDAQLPISVSPPPEESVRVGMIYQHI